MDKSSNRFVIRERPLHIFVRGRCKKKEDKKLTNVSFAFSHTYTLVKLTFFPFSPSVHGKFGKMCKNAKTKRSPVKGRERFCMIIMIMTNNDHDAKCDNDIYDK